MSSSSNFTVYSASAGSGKTFTLAERYLTLLLNSPQRSSFQHILAITFTNKAVGEMKSRILDYLTLFSEGSPKLEDDAMFQNIKKNTQLSSEDIQKKSRSILKEILDNYAAFEISTIDAFTHRIIRTFAKDLGLSMNFDIEMDTKQVLQLAVERVIEKAGKDAELTEVLIAFALDKINEDKSGNISLDIFEASSLLLNEKDEEFIGQLKAYELEDFTTLKHQLTEEMESITSNLKSIGENFLDVLKDQGLEFKDFKRSSIPNYFQKLSENQSNIGYDSAWQRDIEDENTYVNNSQTPTKKQLIFSMRERIVEDFQHSKALFYTRKFYEKVYTNITQLSLLSAVSSEMDLIKKERNIMLISDFNRKISDEIRKQPAPFIYERLGEKFQHYFIDEFQDTSRRQWKNLVPLTENALISLFDRGTPGTLTLVGDAKQSIYAWRGGDADQFIELADGHSPFSVEVKKETLTTNYRSSEAVVDFNNTFFEYVGEQMSNDKLTKLFSGDDLRQNTHKTEKGQVNIRFIDTEGDEDELYPEEVLKVICEKKKLGYKLGQICILVRKKKDGISIAKYLNDKTIPIISSETLLINADAQVQLILNLLNVLNDDKDESSKAKVLEALAKRRNYSEEQSFKVLQATLNKDKAMFWQAINQMAFTFDPHRFQTLPFYDAVEYLIHQFEIDKTHNAYLQFFLDEVVEFTLKQEGNLSAFLAFWELNAEHKSIISTANEDAIQIMTVHKSKGLQFPVVIFPYAKLQLDYALNNHLWVELPKQFELPLALITKPSKGIEHPKYSEHYLNLIKALEMENVNILYVALTRAAKELYIISEDDRKADGSLKSNTFAGLLMSYIENIKHEKIEVNTIYSYGEISEYETTEPIENKTTNKTLQFHHPSPKLNLDLVTTAGKLWNTKLEEALNEGNLIHSILAEIKVKSDVERALQKHLDNGFLKANEFEGYKTTIYNIIRDNTLAEFYTEGYEVWNEREIYFKDQLLRPDRVNLKGQDAYLIDYKTGATSPEHQEQIEAYAEALEGLQYNVKMKMLVYVHPTIDVKII